MAVKADKNISYVFVNVMGNDRVQTRIDSELGSVFAFEVFNVSWQLFNYALAFGYFGNV